MEDTQYIYNMAKNLAAILLTCAYNNHFYNHCWLVKKIYFGYDFRHMSNQFYIQLFKNSRLLILKELGGIVCTHFRKIPINKWINPMMTHDSEVKMKSFSSQGATWCEGLDHVHQLAERVMS